MRARTSRDTRWAVLISGRGSNLASLLEAPDVDVRYVLSSREDAPGLAKARRAGVAADVIPRELSSPSSALDWEWVDSALKLRGIDQIFLLGFMRIVPAKFLARWRGRVFNVHPSLLPKYPGLRALERAYADGEVCGMSVHEVIEEIDAGRILRQRAVEVEIATFEQTEFLVHLDEARSVREVAARWRVDA